MMNRMSFLWVMCITIPLACNSPGNKPESENRLVPVTFNHPGLEVDLGVGLWAWPLPMDYDEDGDMDLIVACTDTPYKGIYFFENTEGAHVKLPVFEPPVKIGPGEKHLQICYVDGEPRVMGRGVEFENFRDSLTMVPRNLFPRDELEKLFEKIRFNQWKYVDYEGDGDQDLIVGIDDWGEYGWDNAFDEDGHWINGPLHGYVFLLENIDGKYTNKGKIMAGGHPVDVYGAPSPNMMDFDGDGDLDLICGEFLDRFTWFENRGSRSTPEFVEGRFLTNEEGVLKMDLEMIIPVAVDWDGDGDADLVVGDEDGRVAFVENSGETLGSMPQFHSPVYFRQKADLLKFGALVTPFAVDWDDDGDQDLICGNTAGYVGFIENMDGGNPPKWNEPVYLEADGEVIRIMAGDSGSIQGPAEKKWGYTTLSVSDWDGDGLQDIIINSIWGKILWYKNTGRKGSPVLSGSQPVRVGEGAMQPKPVWNWWDPEEGHLSTQWRTIPYAIDWTKDGMTDLVMLDSEGYLCLFERFSEDGTLKIGPPQRIFYGKGGSVFSNKNEVLDSTDGPLRLNNQEAGGSGRRKFCFTDWDQDGDLDLLVNSLNISLLENSGEKDGKVWFTLGGPLADLKLAGHTTSPTIVNWNGGSIPDLLIGAEDGHFYYLLNHR